jgi:hypothetical protein
MGAMTNNGVGVAGHDWQARLMMVRVLGNEMGFGTQQRVYRRRIQYAVDNGAQRHLT